MVKKISCSPNLHGEKAEVMEYSLQWVKNAVFSGDNIFHFYLQCFGPVLYEMEKEG